MCGSMPAEVEKSGEIDVTLYQIKPKAEKAESEMECDIEETHRAKSTLKTEGRKVRRSRGGRGRAGSSPQNRNSEPNTTQSNQLASYERSKLMQLPTERLQRPSVGNSSRDHQQRKFESSVPQAVKGQLPQA